MKEKTGKDIYRYLVFDSDACGYYLSALENGRWLVEYAGSISSGAKPALRFPAGDEDDVMKVIRETDDMFLSRSVVPPKVLRSLSEKNRIPVCALGKLSGSRLDRIVFGAKRQNIYVSVARGNSDSVIMFLKNDSERIRRILLDLAVWECSSQGMRISVCSKSRTGVLGMTAANVAKGCTTLIVIPEAGEYLTVDRHGITATGYEGENIGMVNADMLTQSGLSELLRLLPEGCYCTGFDLEDGDEISGYIDEAADRYSHDMEGIHRFNDRTVMLTVACIEAAEKVCPGRDAVAEILSDNFAQAVSNPAVDAELRYRAGVAGDYLRCLDRRETEEILSAVYGKYSDMKNCISVMYNPGEGPEKYPEHGYSRERPGER